jgi:4-carboxymuconolactone decarboxylase
MYGGLSVELQRTLMAALVLVGIVAFAYAQERRELNLKGDRFKPYTWDTLTADQKRMVNEIMSGPRTSLEGPFNMLLRSPELGARIAKVGEYLRFNSTIPRRLNEMAILLTAKTWAAQYEWHAHKPLAVAAGLSTSIIDDIQAGRRPANMQADETTIYEFAKEYREKHRVSDATFSAAVKMFGEQGVVDLVSVMGYYDLISMVLNVDRHPLPPGTPVPFAEPK